MEKITKPPLGVIPNKYWIEIRVSNLWDAVCRYIEADLEPSPEWISELQTHISRLKNDITVSVWREQGYDIIEEYIFSTLQTKHKSRIKN